MTTTGIPVAADAPSALGAADGLPTPRRYWAAAAIWSAMILTVLDSSIANIALPVIARDFSARPAEAVWIVNAYQLASVVCLLPLASLGEVVGFKRVYLAGLALFTAASLGCALSRSLPALAAARTIQGLGAAAVMSVNPALVRFIYPSGRLGRGIGYNAMIISAGAAVGPSLASGILAVAPWPWLFAINLPVGVVALAMAGANLPMNPLVRRRFDTVAATLNALAFGFVITGVDVLTRSRARLVGALEIAAGALAGAALARREWPKVAPLVPFDLLRGRMFLLSIATSTVGFAAQMLAFVSLPFHFEDTLGRGQVATGLLLTPWPVAVGVAAPLAGRLADRVAPALLVVIGLVAFAAGLAALALAPATAGNWDIAWRMALCGAGFGFFQSPNNRMMLLGAPRERSGAAGGMLATARLTGQTLGAAATASLLHLLGTAGETVALWSAAGIALAGAGVSAARLKS
ncbi:MAG: MFS transporter [Caulobacteraceae bacterium]|nr:MFS transporter [Caulobacteraceae bacterium]